MIKLRENERIILTKRKHWFVLLRSIVAPLFFLVLPFVIYGFVAGTELSIGPTATIMIELSPALFTFIGAAWTLLIVMKLASIWTDYYLDVWVVTNMRIVDMEQKSLFHRQTSTFRLDRIQDVTVEIRGIVATLLHFGDIHVQTAGEGQEFVMYGISHPRTVRERILSEQDLLLGNDTSEV